VAASVSVASHGSARKLHAGPGATLLRRGADWRCINHPASLARSSMPASRRRGASCRLQAAGASCERAEQGPCWWALRAPRIGRKHAIWLPSTECYERRDEAGLPATPHACLLAHDRGSGSATAARHEARVAGAARGSSPPADGGTGQGLCPAAHLSVTLHACELTRT